MAKTEEVAEEEEVVEEKDEKKVCPTPALEMRLRRLVERRRNHRTNPLNR